MTNENGFSLLEVSVAVAIMALLTGLSVTIAPGFIGTIKGKTENYASCGTKKEAAVQDLIQGQEPDQVDVVNGQNVAAHECLPERSPNNGGNGNG